MIQKLCGLKTRDICFAFYHKDGCVHHWDLEDKNSITIIRDANWDSIWDEIENDVNSGELATYLAYLLISGRTDSSEMIEYLNELTSPFSDTEVDSLKAWCMTRLPDAAIVYFNEWHELWVHHGEYYLAQTVWATRHSIAKISKERAEDLIAAHQKFLTELAKVPTLSIAGWGWIASTFAKFML